MAKFGNSGCIIITIMNKCIKWFVACQWLVIIPDSVINTAVCPGFNGSVYLLQRDVFDQATDNSAWSRFANIHLLNVKRVGVRVLFSADDAAHSQIQPRHVYFRLFLRRRRGLLLLLLSWTTNEYRSSDDFTYFCVCNFNNYNHHPTHRKYQ